MITALILILSIVGITFYVGNDNIIVVDNDGNNITINYTDIENKTINDIVNIIKNKTQIDITNALRSFDYNSLLYCEVGNYKYGNIELDIVNYPFYNLCVITIESEVFLVDYPINSEFSDYLEEYYDLEDEYEDIEFINITKKVIMNVSALELDKYNIDSINKKTGPLQYEITVTEKYSGYDIDNKYILDFVETNQKMSLTEILNHVSSCSLFEEWNEKWNNDILPNNKEVYDIINEVCE